MTILLFAIGGGLVGLVLRYYLSGFAAQLKQQVYANYCEIFPQATTEMPAESSLQPIKCGGFLAYFCAGTGLFIASYYYFDAKSSAANCALALVYGLSLALLYFIAKLDWHYQIISLQACYLLIALGVACAYLQLSPLSLAQGVQSFACGFGAFWLIFHFAKFYYQQEAFGRGDYWLMGGLASFHDWQSLPLLVLIACLSAILFALRKGKSKSNQFIPFAPFLAIGHIFTLGLNVLA